MKKYALIMIVFTSLVASCSSEHANKKAGDSTEVIALDTTFTSTTLPNNTTDCYVYIKDRDTALLKLKTAGKKLTGKLNYNLFEKDSNKGTIIGEMKGDTIIAEYTFESEGVRSIREVVFVKKDDGKLYEGFGDIEEKKGKMIFKNRSVLKFDPTMVYSKTDCK